MKLEEQLMTILRDMPEWFNVAHGTGDCYGIDQEALLARIRAYGEAVAAVERERCARVVEITPYDSSKLLLDEYDEPSVESGFHSAVGILAARIRSLD